MASLGAKCPNDCWSGLDLAAQWREGEGVTLLLGGSSAEQHCPPCKGPGTKLEPEVLL